MSRGRGKRDRGRSPALMEIDARVRSKEGRKEEVVVGSVVEGGRPRELLTEREGPVHIGPGDRRWERIAAYRWRRLAGMRLTDQWPPDGARAQSLAFGLLSSALFVFFSIHVLECVQMYW